MRLSLLLLLLACLAVPARAQNGPVGVVVLTDASLRGGTILVRKDGTSAWETKGTVIGLSSNDTITLNDHENYEIRVEKRGFFQTLGGQTKFQPFSQMGHVQVQVPADPPQWNGLNVALAGLLPVALVPPLVMWMLAGRTRRRHEAALQEAKDTARATAAGSQEATEAIRRFSKTVLPPNLEVGRYKVIGMIGEGGMASVYQVEDGEGTYAMKVPHREALTDPKFTERFKREMEICVRFYNKHIVKTYDTGFYQADGVEVPFIVMELVKGKTLDDVVEEAVGRGDPPDLEFAMIAAKGIAEGLSTAHERGIIHRDIKPGNVIVTFDNVIKVMDFGIARVVSETTISATSVIGTPTFMAPEQLSRAYQPDARADLYALGMVLYYLTTHKQPFFEDDIGTMLFRRLTEEMIPPIVENPRLSRGFNALIMRLIEKDLDRRFQSTVHLLAALESLEAHPERIPTGLEPWANRTSVS